MAKLFNSAFEISLRIMLLLSASGAQGMTIDRISAYDFIAIYSRFFGLSETSLHGNNDFGFSEFATRRNLIQNALKSMVLDGMVYVLRKDDGFHYSININGKALCSNLTVEYATAYSVLAKKVMEKYDPMNEVELLSVINKESTKALRR